MNYPKNGYELNLMSTLFKNILGLPSIMLLSTCAATSTYAQNYEQTIYSILSYINWKTTKPKICVVDNAALYKNLANHLSAQKNKFEIQSITSASISNQHCQTLVFSTLTPDKEQYLLNNAVNFPALSISTNNTQC